MEYNPIKYAEMANYRPFDRDEKIYLFRQFPRLKISITPKSIIEIPFNAMQSSFPYATKFECHSIIYDSLISRDNSSNEVKNMRAKLEVGLRKHEGNMTSKESVWYVNKAKDMLAKSNDELQVYIDAMTMQNEQSDQEAEAIWTTR